MKSLAKILLILPLLFARVVDAVTFQDACIHVHEIDSFRPRSVMDELK